ncbi:Arylsulfatase A [Fodinibius roseus]|uniref:Arylsulfatase A n=1 Tax=Fodinibius roseus TaxID=1194090 RepID=A0A1M5D5I3_9BACT|nr:sulfatase [Fodinibius roseus]SHF62115.1 Arylsulfatase A [Fodinibius roseus]
MNRFFLILLLVFSITACSKYSQNEKPNIVWIIAEDLSQDLGVYENELVNTPNIDQLAQKGVTFTNVFTTAAVCTPSRTALATGMYQTSIGAHHMGYPDELKPNLPDSIQTVHQVFKENGYITANIEDEPANGKTHWAFKADLKANFDYNHWNSILSQSKPFFAQISISNTHRPFPEVKSNGNILDKVKIPPYYPDHEIVRKEFIRYYESINILDDKVGQILSFLKRSNLAKDTIVILFSDHGRPMTRGKYWNYDSGIRVPMIIHMPRGLTAPVEYIPGSTENQLISHIDITATTLSFAGIQKPNYMQGRIFWGKGKEKERQYVFSTSDRISELHFQSRAVRSQKYKYIRNYRHNFSINGASTAYRKANHPVYHVLNILHKEDKLTSEQLRLLETLPKEELYYLDNDPHELYNLAADSSYLEQLQIHRKALDNWIATTQDKGMEADDEEVISAFNEIGKQSYERFQDQIQQLHEQIGKELNRSMR